MPATEIVRSSRTQTRTSPMPLTATRALCASSCSPWKSLLPEMLSCRSPTSPAMRPSPAPETLNTSCPARSWSKRASPAPEMLTRSRSSCIGPAACTSAAPEMPSRDSCGSVTCSCSRRLFQNFHEPGGLTRSTPPRTDSGRSRPSPSSPSMRTCCGPCARCRSAAPPISMPSNRSSTTLRPCAAALPASAHSSSGSTHARRRAVFTAPAPAVAC